MEWKVSEQPVDYLAAVAAMEGRVRAIRAGEADELVWLLEHPPLYTAGTSAQDGDLLDSNGFPVYKTGRGGQYTYHGPGQRIAYIMLDLKRRTPDVRLYVQQLEQLVIATLADFDVTGEIREGRVGVWVREKAGSLSGEDKAEAIAYNGKESKIAALGVRIRQWVTYHGVAVNISPNLDHYKGIVPCGITEHGVTSLQQLGKNVGYGEFDTAFRKAFHTIF
ncbi:MAG TPA: lipoyl(octanoyl) transferase LipB [Rickettsiales bacterium]|nr:lipoyl(octanoyl) transferase LipB [Rickettsiales bacterium]